MIRYLLIILLLNFSMALHANTAPKTFYFYIAGDYQYEGPVWNDVGKDEIKDQAHLLYKQVYQQARKDKLNNYVIFFDPKGSSYFFSKRVRFRYFYKGRKVKSNGFFEREIDMTNIDVFRRLTRDAKKKIKNLEETEKILYYYGEHIPYQPNGNYDLSEKKSSMSYKTFVAGVAQLETVGEFSTLILHTCYNANFDFYNLLRTETTVKNIIASADGTPRATSDTLALITGDLTKFINDNNNGKYPFKFFNYLPNKYFGKLNKFVSKLISVSDAKASYSTLQKISQTKDPESISEILTTPAKILPTTQEVLISLSDSINIFLSNISNEETLNSILLEYKDLLTNIPKLNINTKALMAQLEEFL